MIRGCCTKQIVYCFCSPFRHLTEHGVRYFCARSKNFVLVTSNENYPAFSVDADNLHVIVQEVFDPQEMLMKLKRDYGCERITVQTGGTWNALFLRAGLLDYVDIVVAPVLIGGKETASLIDGAAFTDVIELDKLGILELQSCETLAHSYLRLKYKIVR